MHVDFEYPGKLIHGLLVVLPGNANHRNSFVGTINKLLSAETSLQSYANLIKPTQNDQVSYSLIAYYAKVYFYDVS